MQKNYRFSKNLEGTVLIVGIQIWRYNLIIARTLRSPPPCMGGGGLTPSSFSSCISAKVRWLWIAVKKSPYLALAFSKLVLDDVKVEILLISWHFVVIFWLWPQPPIHWHPHFFGILKVLRWYTSEPSLIYIWYIVLEFWIFKCFYTSRKYNFRLLLVGFLDLTHWNVIEFVWNFEQWCNTT